MQLNGDLWKWLEFAIKVIKTLIEMFGDPDEKEKAKNIEVKIVENKNTG